MTRLILFGAPGSGKGTIADLLHQEFGYAKLSTGDMIREEVRRESAIGCQAQALMERGELVSDELVIAMLQSRLTQADARQGYILDGFPRTLPQARSLSNLAVDREMAVFLDVSETEVEERLTGRLVCVGCGAIYNRRNKPPRRQGVCDVCGAKLEQRADDQPQTIRQRLRVYLRQTRPVIEYYRQQGHLQHVDGAGDAAAVYARVKGLLS